MNCHLTPGSVLFIALTSMERMDIRANGGNLYKVAL